jgi:hypothetical protein
MLKFKFAMDVNGNKIVKVTRKGFRGFSIQTNGNLPQTHHMNADNMDAHIIHDELRAFCSIYGTERQREILYK